MKTASPYSWLYAFSSVFFLLLLALLPIVALPEMMHDDGWFYRNALRFRSGHWMGPYNQMTLIKGPGFPLWLSFCMLLGIPFLVAQGIGYLLGIGMILRNLGPSIKNQALLFLVYLVFIFNPAQFGWDERRVFRDSFCGILVVFIAALILALFTTKTKTRRVRCGIAAALGVCIGVFWITREDAVWLAPGLAAAVAILLVREVVQTAKACRKKNLATVIVLTVTTLIFSSSVVNAVALINKAKYGVYEEVEFKEPDFISAHSSITRVIPKPWIPYVPATKASLKQIAAVSPLFNQVFQKIDFGWSMFGCQSFHIQPCDGEIRAHFMWALRDAVAADGFYSSAPAAKKLYSSLSSEIDAACANGKLSCLPKRHSFAPYFRPEYVKQFPRELVNGIIQFTSFDGVYGESVESNQVYGEQSKQMARNLHSRVFSHGKAQLIVLRFTKWLYSLYHLTAPVLFLIGLFSFGVMIGSAIIQREIPCLLGFNVVLFLFIVSRIALLTYVGMTAFPGVVPIYVQCAYPLLLLFSTTSVIGGFQELRSFAGWRRLAIRTESYSN